MSEPLTREQVEALKCFDVTNPEVELVNLGGNLSSVGIGLALKLMIDTDAALRARVRELEQRQAWIDTVGPPNHPDDERQWVLAYLSAQEEVTALTQAHQQAVEALKEIDKLLVEINPSNYDDQDVVEQNGSVISAIEIARATLATHKEQG